MEIPRRGKFYQGRGLKHTSDIYLLTTQSFIIRFSPHTGGNTWHLQKQRNKRVSIPPPPKERLRILSPSLQGMSAWPATFNRHSLVIRRINFSCAHLDDAHMSILIREHFIHSTQTPLTAWSILINNEYYIPNLQVFF